MYGCGFRKGINYHPHFPQIVKRLDNGNDNRQTRKRKQAGSLTTKLYPSRIPQFFPPKSSVFEELSGRSIDLVGMAARAACRGVVSQFGNNPGNGLSLSRLGSIGTRSRTKLLFSPSGDDFRCGRNFSELSPANKRRLFLVDTLALVRKLEAQGIPTKQAEVITSSITGVLSDSLENVSHSYVSKEEMQKGAITQESNLSKFKSEVQNSQGNHFSLLQSETEKLRADIEKLQSEFKYEIDKVTAGQRLDLNLERGRIRDELAKQSAETSNLTNKLDREIHALRAQLEAAKYEVIKYCIGSLVSISAVGLAVLRVMM